MEARTRGTIHANSRTEECPQMTPRGKHRGWPMSFDGEAWRYDVDGVRVSDEPNRSCGHCGQANTPEGHDACIPNLPGVRNACCGHGDPSEAYVQFESGEVVLCDAAVEYFQTRYTEQLVDDQF